MGIVYRLDRYFDQKVNEVEIMHVECGKEGVDIEVVMSNGERRWMEVEVCPYVGSIAVQISGRICRWECPVCGSEHEWEFGDVGI